MNANAMNSTTNTNTDTRTHTKQNKSNDEKKKYGMDSKNGIDEVKKKNCAIKINLK